MVKPIKIFALIAAIFFIAVMIIGCQQIVLATSATSEIIINAEAMTGF